VELHEASLFGLLERIPDLLTSVNVDTVGYVSLRQMIQYYVPTIQLSNYF